MGTFTRLLAIDCPPEIQCRPDGRHPAFTVRFTADGKIPFPQVILRTAGGRELLPNGDAIQALQVVPEEWIYTAYVPAGITIAERIDVQVEGCRQANLEQAKAEDWIKAHQEVRLIHPERPQAEVRAARVGDTEAKLYFGIHKHMHQPYYNTTNQRDWDGGKDQIFGSRGGNYTDFVPGAVQQYIDGGLPHAGLSTSWSGSLIEQLDRCGEEGLCGGRFRGWNSGLRRLAQARTALGNPRLCFSAFGFFHPLMPLIPDQDIVRQIHWHRDLIQRAFGGEASRVMFPPETAFHVRMIPALVEAGGDGGDL